MVADLLKVSRASPSSVACLPAISPLFSPMATVVRSPGALGHCVACLPIKKSFLKARYAKI